MTKLLILFSLSCSLTMYCQNFRLKYEFEAFYESKLVECHSYDSETGIYEEINYDRNTFNDTTNINQERYEAYIPLVSPIEKDICTLLKSSNFRENTFISGVLGKSEYIKYSIYIYKNGKLINNDSRYLNRKNKTKKFDNILRLVLDFIQSSEEYNRIFYWHEEKR